MIPKRECLRLCFHIHTNNQHDSKILRLDADIFIRMEKIAIFQNTWCTWKQSFPLSSVDITRTPTSTLWVYLFTLFNNLVPSIEVWKAQQSEAPN